MPAVCLSGLLLSVAEMPAEGVGNQKLESEMVEGGWGETLLTLQDSKKWTCNFTIPGLSLRHSKDK